MHLNKKIIGIIPARYDSSRLPGKPLVFLNKKTMIQWVYENAIKCSLLKKVIIATGDTIIKKVAENFGAEVVMTSKDLKSGTDRVYYAIKKLKEKYDYVVNIQGDEPLLSSQSIQKLIENTVPFNREIGTLGKVIKNKKLFNNPNIVKIVIDKNRRALYFSRSPLPYNSNKFIKHIGIYIYRSDILERFVKLSSELEKMENLEQLRAIENGIPVYITFINQDTHPVDTEEDIRIVEKKLKKIKK